MGLDAVELILAWEDGFGIELSDDEVFTIRTPKQAIDLISQKLGASSDRVGVCPVMRSHCIRQAFQEVAGLPRQQIQLNSKLRLLLPKDHRQIVWNQIHASIGVPKFPSFGFGAGVLFMPVTVRHLVDWTVAHYPHHFVRSDERWTQFQVRSVVRAIVRDVTSATDFSDESDFVEEMGID